MANIPQLKALNAARWEKMQVVPRFEPVLLHIAQNLVAPMAKSRYTIVSANTTVPWYVIAVIHERECSQSWNGSLAQGDPWNRVSIHVPKGRGPFENWESAAIDALRNCAPFAAKWMDWTSGGLLTLLEEYNGLGYAAYGVPSPYIWASTDQYSHGKYVSDGHYDPNAVDTQLGCAALLRTMQKLDADIKIAQFQGM